MVLSSTGSVGPVLLPGSCTGYERARPFRQFGPKFLAGVSIPLGPIVAVISGASRPAEETVTMPQYLLCVWFDELYDDADVSSPEAQAQMARTDELNAEMERAGAWVFAAGLRPASSATVVRASGGEVSMTDGPYAETKEQMGGLWIIDAADLDAALEWAAKAAVACGQPIEVRPTHAA
jgi:hypothetical protein